jgi:hypothetical protein
VSDTPETDGAERMAFSQEYMVPTKFARKLERERDEARAMCPNGLWVSDADYQRLHTAASCLLTKVNAAIPPGFFQQIEREYDDAMKALYP